MKRPTAKGSEPRLVQGNLGSTAQQLCDHGHVTEPQFPHLWSGEKKSTILHMVRVEKGHTCRNRSLRGNAFLHVPCLSFSTSGGSVSHLSTTTVIGHDALWDSVQSAFSFINSCHSPPHFQFSENNSSTLHFLNGKGMNSCYKLFLKLRPLQYFS